MVVFAAGCPTPAEEGFVCSFRIVRQRNVFCCVSAEAAAIFEFVLVIGGLVAVPDAAVSVGFFVCNYTSRFAA